MRVALLTFISALFAACLIAPAAGQTGADLAKANDINTLNFALALERLEAVYYTCHLSPLNTTTGSSADCANRGYTGFTQADFIAAGYNASIYNAVVAIGLQERSHEALLAGAVTSLGGTPVPACTYNFNALQPVTSVATFLSLSAILENTGVSAYTGALNSITDPNYQQVAATIATVEARHAAWLNQLLGTQPFATSGFDTYRTPQEIAAIVSPALGSANCVSTLPTTRPFGVAGASATATNQTGPLSNLNNVTYTALQRQNDLKTLNYALMLEELEANFYYNASLLFNQSSFTNAGYSAAAYQYFQIIAANEQTHVAVLRATITSYGGTPIQNCTYNFTGALSSFANYIQFAQVLENTGVSAYDGAANTLTDTNLQRIAATIATIEARHAAYINILITNPRNDTNAFPSDRDTAIPARSVVPAVVGTGLIASAASCPFTIDDNFFPNVLPTTWGIPNGTIVLPAATSSSSTGSVPTNPSSSSSTGFNGASSSSAFSLAMIVVAIIASLALVL